MCLQHGFGKNNVAAKGLSKNERTSKLKIHLCAT